MIAIKEKAIKMKSRLQKWWDQDGKPIVIGGLMILVPAVAAGVAGYYTGRKDSKITGQKFGDYVDEHTESWFKIDEDQKKVEMWLRHDDGAEDYWWCNYGNTSDEGEGE